MSFEKSISNAFPAAFLAAALTVVLLFASAVAVDAASGDDIMASLNEAPYDTSTADEPVIVPGDLNGDGAVDTDDVIYLLYNCFFPDTYPLNQACDFNGDGLVDCDDALYLLNHCYYLEGYPLEPGEVEAGGVVFTGTVSDEGLAITGAYEEGSDPLSRIGGALEIPAFVQPVEGTSDPVLYVASDEGIPVTSIGSRAFSYYSSIESVTIPGTVASIGSRAFSHCDLMAAAVLQEGVASIGDNAFDSCRLLESVQLPGTLKAIGSSAFLNCESLASVEIPGSVESIGNRAFRMCESLGSAVIGDGVASIGDNAFSDCSALVSVTIPGSVQHIGDHAFDYCDSLTYVDVTDSETPMPDLDEVLSELIAPIYKGAWVPGGSYMKYSGVWVRYTVA